MQNQHTIVVGQILQYRDKLYAKRHSIPKELKDKWNKLIVQVDKLTPNVNPRTRQKSISFQGGLEDLKSLLLAITKFNDIVVG